MQARHVQPRRSARISTILLGLTLAVLAASSAGAQLSLASQNCLHLGWGKEAYQNNKNAILGPFFAGVDVVALQEVMAQANLATVTPGTHFFLVSAPQGPSTYKEAYGFLVRSTLTAVTLATTTVAGFARPPIGALVGSGGTWTWIVDYHAVYGRSISTRRTEVSRMPLVYQGFQATMINGVTFPRVVVAGDWNLAANDRTFQDFATNGWPIDVQPTSKTSLKRNGGPSQPYDHFLWDTTAVTVTQPLVIPVPNPPGSGSGWRQQVSDHLGIACLIN